MQVQDYLRINSIDKLKEELGINGTRHKKYPNLVLFKYNQIDSPRAHPMVMECRGLILDESNDWAVVSRPYDRFFNSDEGHAAPIDWSTAKVYEKLDGSLMTLYWYDGQWNVSSSGSPDASGPVNNDSSTTFSELFWKTFNDLKLDLGAIPDYRHDLCFMFELMTPQNRVVVPHTTSRLVLHGVRSTYTGEEFEPNLWAFYLNAECVKSYPIQTINDLLVASKALNPMQCEGFVVVDNKFNRIKVKSPQYVALSHMKDSFSQRRMIELVRTNEGSEFLSYFPEYAPLYNEIKGKFDKLVSDLTATYSEIKDIEAQKDFAIKATKTKLSAALFSIRAKKVATVQEYLAGMSITGLESALGY